MLVNWQLRHSKEDIPDEQPSNKVVEGEKYWFFRHWDGEEFRVDVVDFTKLPGLHTIERRFLKFYVAQALRVLPCLDRYDLIISHSAQSGLFIAFLRTLLGRKNPPQVIIDPGSFNGGRDRLLELLPIRMSLPSVAGVIGHSRCQIPYYTDILSLTPDRFSIVHVGVDTDFYSPADDAPLENYVACIGYMKRDWDTLLATWQKIEGDCRLLIVGKEGLGPEIAGVSCMPYVSRSKLKEIIQRARFVVIPLPYYEYSFGQMSLLISQALGKAVIVTRVPGLLDYVDDGRTALFVDPYDIEDLRRKISLLLSNPEMASELGRKARDAVVSEYSEKQMGLRLKEAIDELCRKIQG
ncbi:MAG: glycosyltransferase family 4 protein [bacterium]